MNEPVRLQLSRRKGFNLQAVSIATNGLKAVRVTRPGRWGNPYRVGVDGSANECVGHFRSSLDQVKRNAIKSELRGMNLACWCKIGEPCHADVLLEIANA